MNILVITGLYDEQPQSGGSFIMKHYVQGLIDAGHHVVLMYDTTANEQLPTGNNIISLSQLKNSFYAKQGLLSKVFNKVSALRGTKEPKDIESEVRQYLYRNFKWLRTDLHVLCKLHNIDIIQVDFPWMMNVASVFPQGIPSVFVSHEMQAVRLEREAGLNSAGEQKNALLKKANAFAFHEALLAKNYSAVLTLTNVEKVFWEKHLPDKFVFNSPMGISLQPAVEKRPIQAEKLVYLSNGKHVPNVNGLLFFFKDVWPLLEDKLQIPFHITGHYSEEVHALAPKSDKIVWAGFVPNLSEFMANSISIVPILLGSGVRIKILESMALGAPVVSTSMGAEGIMAEQGRDILIADEPVRFAELILKLVADQDAYKQIRENALAQVAVHYQLEETIQQRVGIFKKLLTK